MLLKRVKKSSWNLKLPKKLKPAQISENVLEKKPTAWLYKKDFDYLLIKEITRMNQVFTNLNMFELVFFCRVYKQQGTNLVNSKQ